jgi:hypothetical protein
MASKNSREGPFLWFPKTPFFLAWKNSIQVPDPGLIHTGKNVFNVQYTMSI